MEPLGPQFVIDNLNSTPIASLPPFVQTLILVVVALSLAGLLAKVGIQSVRTLTSKTKTNADDIIISRVEKPITILFFTGFLHLSLAPLVVADGLAGTLRSILTSINIIASAYVLSRLVGSLFKVWKEEVASKTESVLDDTMLPLLSKFAGVAIWIFAGIFVLSAWGIEIGPFLAGLGIAGIAIGFAVRDSLNNIFSGIALAFDAAYKVGDKVRLADGTVGIVRDITLRSTRIESYDGDMVMVPNGKIANEAIYSFAQPNEDSRVTVEFGVEYGSDVEDVEQSVKEVLSSMEGVKREPKVVFDSMGDSAIGFKAFFFLFF